MRFTFESFIFVSVNFPVDYHQHFGIANFPRSRGSAQLWDETQVSDWLHENQLDMLNLCPYFQRFFLHIFVLGLHRVWLNATVNF